MLTPYLGEIVLYAFDFAPSGWLQCRGEQLPVAQYAQLFSLLGTKFGGDGKSGFALPNYQSVSPPGLMYCIAHEGVYPVGPRPCAVGETAILPYNPPDAWMPCDGQILAIEESEVLFTAIGNVFGGDGQSTFGLPSLGSTAPTAPTTYAITGDGEFGRLPDSFLAEVCLLPYPQAPRGWVSCQGQLMPISQNRALFALISNRFGGDGTSNFALPNLSGAKVPNGMHYYIALQGVYPAPTRAGG